MHSNSGMLRGILQAGNQVLSNVNGVVICTRAADDTSSNQLATAPGVNASGGSGMLTQLVWHTVVCIGWKFYHSVLD